MKCTHFIGIDVSKATFDLAMMTLESSGIVAQKQFANSSEGFEAFYQWLKQKVGASGLCAVVCCLEHTGLYDLELSLFLHRKSIAYSHQNALSLKRSMGLIRGKNDKVDAQRLALFIRKERDDLSLSQPAPRSLIQLHRLFTARELLVKQQKALRMHIKTIEVIQRDGIVSKLKGYFLQLTKQVQAKIKKVEGHIGTLIKGNPELKRNYKLLLSVPGIGLVNAVYLLVTTKNFTAFQTWRQYAAYAGTAPFEYSSGTSVGGRKRVHYFANKKAKTLLTNAATSARLNSYEIKSFYQKKQQEGKAHFWIINAIRNKIISRAFAVVRRQKPYQSVDQFEAWQKESKVA